MEEILSCSLCSERYDRELRRPKVLDCGHTFCLDCLERHDRANGRFCPTDRKEFFDLPRCVKDNYLLSPYLDTPTTDDLDTKNSKATKFWCMQCSRPANPRCVDQHSICNMNSVLVQKVKDAKRAVREQFQRESAVLQSFIDVLRPVREAAATTLATRIQDDIAYFQDAKEQSDRSANLAETIPGTALQGREGAAEELQSLLSLNAERVSILEERRSLLRLAESCSLSVSAGHATWGGSLQLGADSSAEERVLVYLLYLLLAGRQPGRPGPPGPPGPPGQSGAFSVRMPSAHQKPTPPGQPSAPLAEEGGAWGRAVWGQGWASEVEQAPCSLSQWARRAAAMVAPKASLASSSSVLDSGDSDDDDDDDSDLESVLSEASANDTTPNTRKIFIQALPSAATRQDLKGIFAPHGNLSDIKIFNKKRGTKLVACAILIFDDEESVKTILANTPYFFGQFKLDVRENRRKHTKRNRKERRAGKVDKKDKEPKSKPYKLDKKNAAAAGDSKSSSKENKSEFDDNCKLFVGGVPLVATEEELKKIFKDYGTLVDVRLRPPKLATQKFAFAFVTYTNRASVVKVLKDRPIKYYNYTNGPTCTILNVTEHKSKEDSKQNSAPSATSKDGFVVVDKSELGKQPRSAQPLKPSPQPRPQQQQPEQILQQFQQLLRPQPPQRPQRQQQPQQQQQQQQQPRGPQQPIPPQQPFPPQHQRAQPHMQQGPTSPTTLYPALNEIRDTNTALRNDKPVRRNDKDCCVQ